MPLGSRTSGSGSSQSQLATGHDNKRSYLSQKIAKGAGLYSGESGQRLASGFTFVTACESDDDPVQTNGLIRD